MGKESVRIRDIFEHYRKKGAIVTIYLLNGYQYTGVICEVYEDGIWFSSFMKKKNCSIDCHIPFHAISTLEIAND